MKLISIPGYPNYLVSSCGQVWSNRSNKYLSPTPNTRGYLTVNLSKNGKTKVFSVHRLVLTTYSNPPSLSHQVNHINGDKLDNSLDNLEWCTAKENTQHAIRVGLRCTKGESHGRSKLQEKDIHTIRESSKSNTELSKDYSVAHQTISDIRRRRIWKHVE